MTRETNSFASVFVVLAGYVLSITAFTLGGSIAVGLDFKSGIIAMLGGNLILALYAGLLGYICWKANRSSSEMYKPVFGTKGQILATSIVGLFVIGFTAVYCALIGSMTPVIFPSAPASIGIIAIVMYLIVTIAVNITGFKGISLFGKVAIPAIGIFVIAGVFMIQKNVGFENVVNYQPTTSISLFTAISLVAASWMVGATVSADMTRYVVKPSYVPLVCIAAFFCVAILESVGMFMGMATGESNMVTTLSLIGMSGSAYAIYLLLSLTSGIPSVMIVSNNILNILSVFPSKEEQISKGKITAKTFIIPISIVAGILGVYLMSGNFTGKFIAMIGLIGTTIPPVGGVFAAYYLFVETNADKAFENVPEYNVWAFVAWIVGIIVANLSKWGVATLNGFVAAGIAFILINKIVKRPNGGIESDEQ